MNIKRHIKEEINKSESDFDWVSDQDPNNIHIRNLEKGMEVMVSCRSSNGREKFPSVLNRKLTVDYIYDDYREGSICVHFNDMGGIKYPFGYNREPLIPGLSICESLGCNFKLIKYIDESDTSNKSKDMQWVKDVKPIKIGDCLRGRFYREILPYQNTYIVTDILFSVIQLKIIPNAYHNATITKPITEVINAIEKGYMVVCDCLEDCHENINESESNMDWIKDVPDKLPLIHDRTKIGLKDFLMDFMEDKSSGVLEGLYDSEQYKPTDEYFDNIEAEYGPAHWENEGLGDWVDYDWKEHGYWTNHDGTPWVGNFDLLEELEMGCDSWEFIERKTDDYDLEYGGWNDSFIFKRKRDGRYFSLMVGGSYQDGIEDHWDFLYEVFPQMKLVYESDNIKKVIRKEINESDFEWIDHDSPLDDISFKTQWKGIHTPVFTIKDNGDPNWVSITWINSSGVKQESTYVRNTVNKFFREGTWIPINNTRYNSITIKESKGLDWMNNFQWTADMLLSMLENCNEIKVSNYNLKNDKPYTIRGKNFPIYTLTRCEEWWDKFSQIPLDKNNRGPAEWYDDYDEGRIGLISTYGPKYKNIRDINLEDIDQRWGWTISQTPQQIVNSLNGKGGELYILLDENHRPIYDLIPKEYREKIKSKWEDYFYDENLKNTIKEEIKRPSEKEFKQALKDILTLIPSLSHQRIHDEGLEHDSETMIRLNKEILEKVKEGDDEVLDELWEISGTLIMKNAINIITFYTKWI